MAAFNVRAISTGVGSRIAGDGIGMKTTVPIVPRELTPANYPRGYTMNDDYELTILDTTIGSADSKRYPTAADVLRTLAGNALILHFPGTSRHRKKGQLYISWRVFKPSEKVNPMEGAMKLVTGLLGGGGLTGDLAGYGSALRTAWIGYQPASVRLDVRIGTIDPRAAIPTGQCLVRTITTVTLQQVGKFLSEMTSLRLADNVSRAGLSGSDLRDVGETAAGVVAKAVGFELPY